MTQNQLAYQANLEAKRANEAREAELLRSNLEKEKVNRQEQGRKSFETGWNFVKSILNPFSWLRKFD